MARRISISDVTIKQADNKPEGAIPFRKKIELSKMLDRLGVSVIETGPILDGRQGCLLVKSIASAVKNSTLAVPVDIANPESVEQTWNSLKEAVKPRLQVCVPTSAVQMEYLCHKKPAGILQLISDLVSRCAALCKEVEFVACDFGRSDDDFLSEAIKTAVQAGAAIVTIWDMAGNLLPDEFSSSVKKVKSMLPENVRLGVCCSNEMFMADSCAIASVIAGADEIKTAAFNNSIASLKRFVHILNAKSDACDAFCGVNVTELQRAINQMKLLCEVGDRKTCSSLSGVTSDRGEVRLTVHDDINSVTKAAAVLGYDLSEEDASKVYETFVRLASKNEVIEAKELDAIVASVAFQVPPTYRLESFVINSGNIISATCHLRLLKGDSVLDSICVGDGPVDASFQAIEKVVDRQYELDDFQIQSVTEGREAMGEAVVRLRCGGKVYSGRGISTDIVGSSIRAYLNAVNKIVYEEEQA